MSSNNTSKINTIKEKAGSVYEGSETAYSKLEKKVTDRLKPSTIVITIFLGLCIAVGQAVGTIVFTSPPQNQVFNVYANIFIIGLMATITLALYFISYKQETNQAKRNLELATEKEIRKPKLLKHKMQAALRDLAETVEYNQHLMELSQDYSRFEKQNNAYQEQIEKTVLKMDLKVNGVENVDTKKVRNLLKEIDLEVGKQEKINIKKEKIDQMNKKDRTNEDKIAKEINEEFKQERETKIKLQIEENFERNKEGLPALDLDGKEINISSSRKKSPALIRVDNVKPEAIEKLDSSFNTLVGSGSGTLIEATGGSMGLKLEKDESGNKYFLNLDGTRNYSIKLKKLNE